MIEIKFRPQTTLVLGVRPRSAQEHAIRAELSYLVPGYERSPEYIYGRWDGKRYLFVYRAAGYHELPTGLVPRLVNILERQGAAYTLSPPPLEWRPSAELDFLRSAAFPMWPHQIASVMALYRPRQGRLGGVIQVATGGGKTRVAAKLIQMTRMPTVFYTHTKDLLYQAINEFRATLQCPIGQIGDGVVDIQPITVATVQSVCRAFGITDKSLMAERSADYGAVTPFIRRAKLVFVDECHHAAAETVQAVVSLSREVVGVVGLSASPWRDDGLDLLIEAACGPVVHRVSASDLIDAGVLVPPRIIAYHLPMPSQLTPLHNSDQHHELYKAWVVNNPERNAFVAHLAQHRMAAGRTVLILVKQVDHGRMLAGRIPGAEFLEGADGSRKRNAILKRVREGTVPCLVTTSLGDEGLDLKIVSTVILAGAGKSSTKALQRIGRALRRHDASGKVDAEIYDLVDNHRVFRKQYWKRTEIYQTERCFKVNDVYLKDADWYCNLQAV